MTYRPDITDARRRARSAARASGTSHQSELDAEAVRRGYADWAAMLRDDRGIPDAPAGPEPGGWFRRLDAAIQSRLADAAGRVTLPGLLMLYATALAALNLAVQPLLPAPPEAAALRLGMLLVLLAAGWSAVAGHLLAPRLAGRDPAGPWIRTGPLVALAVLLGAGIARRALVGGDPLAGATPAEAAAGTLLAALHLLALHVAALPGRLRAAGQGSRRAGRAS